MNGNFAHLIGFLLSDGSVYYDKSKRTYCVQFTNKSENLRSIFKYLMKTCFQVTKFYEIAKKDVISVRVFSKRIADILFLYSPTFRTLPCNQFPKCNDHLRHGKCLVYNFVEYPPCRIPKEVLENKEYSKRFIQGFTSGDGTLTIFPKYGAYRVELTCFHPFLREQILYCLKSLDFKTRSNWRSVFVSGKDNVSKFLSTVGYVK